VESIRKFLFDFRCDSLRTTKPLGSRCTPTVGPHEDFVDRDSIVLATWLFERYVPSPSMNVP